jgi:creatinine amidohydrolase/Fe(II)-dependent formamide hydrolase-like protein
MRARVLPLVMCLFLAVARAAAAGPPDTVFLEELTWTELRDQIGAGKTTVLVPVGGTEQNGPAIALGKHNARVRALAERVARALGDALVAPVVAYVPEGRVSPPTGHMRFPGTLSVPESAFAQMLEGAARSLRQHGARDVVFLGDHGPTQAVLRAVAARLNREWGGTPARAHAVEEYYRAAQTEFPRLLRERGYRAEEIGTHAGLADTALTLALAPDLVRGDRLKPGTGERGDGADGDPRRATAALGAVGVDTIVAHTVDAVRKSLGRR